MKVGDLVRILCDGTTHYNGPRIKNTTGLIIEGLSGSSDAKLYKTLTKGVVVLLGEHNLEVINESR